MDRAEKAEVLGEIKEAFSNVMSVIVAEYAGITVPTVTAMRDDFRKNGCHYRVIKNSLVKIAVKGTPMESISPIMIGATAVMWSTESAQTPAKLALKWAKDQPKFVVKGGFFDGNALDAKGVDALSKLPTKPEIQAQLLMTFLAAPAQFARLLEARRSSLAASLAGA
jgi:large subunit ribosomal protein L10